MKFGITSGTTGVLAAMVIGLILSAGSGQDASAAGADASGCPALGNREKDNSGMQSFGLMSPEAAVALSVAQITDAWYAAHGYVEADYIAERLGSLRLWIRTVTA
jgi:hypothetical protein